MRRAGKIVTAALLFGAVLHDAVLDRHRERLDALERQAMEFARGLRIERELNDEINDDFDKLLVVTVPRATEARPWLSLLNARPGVVGARAALDAWLADARERAAREQEPPELRHGDGGDLK